MLARMGEFTVTMREEDLYRGFLLNAANRRTRPVTVALLVVLGVLMALVTVAPGARQALVSSRSVLVLEGAVLLAAVLLALVLAVREPVLRSMARRTLEQRRELATPVSWSFDDAALRIVTRFTRSEFPWDALRGWREDHATLLVYLSDQLFHAVPKHQVDEEPLAALRSALDGHGVPRR